MRRAEATQEVRVQTSGWRALLMPRREQEGGAAASRHRGDREEQSIASGSFASKPDPEILRKMRSFPISPA